MLKYVRITVSVLSLTACVLLSALWIRSYTWIENFDVLVTSTRSATFRSGLGELTVHWTFDPDAAYQFSPERNWRYRSCSAQGIIDAVARMEPSGVFPPQPNFGFRRRNSAHSYLFVRHWIPVVITAVLAAALGIRRPFRFRLRTMLIATAYAALLLVIVICIVGR